MTAWDQEARDRQARREREYELSQPDFLTFERDLTNRAGEVFRVRVEIDLRHKLEAEVARLANKALSSKNQKCASSAGGVVRVCVRGGAS
jgi:hypothetical protein